MGVCLHLLRVVVMVVRELVRWRVTNHDFYLDCYATKLIIQLIILNKK